MAGTLDRTASPRITWSSALRGAAGQLINGLRDGTMSETAYDTVVVSRLRADEDLNRLAFPATIEWLGRHQHADGSWGGRIEIPHDRIVSTLAAITRLADLPDPWVNEAVQRGVTYLQRCNVDWFASPFETVAFELLVPQLLHDAVRLGLRLPFDLLGQVTLIRAEKLQRISLDALYDRPTTLAHSLEFLGSDIDHHRVVNVRSPNGSYGNSPSATAHVLAFAYDDQAERYLRRVLDTSLNGGACTVYPFEIFEKAWVLYNLGIAGVDLWASGAQLQYLYKSLTPEGVGLSHEGLVPDSDSTSVTLAVLERGGYPVDLDILARFESDDCFTCLPLERNPSVSANAHVLESLKPERARYAAWIAKILGYLEAQKREGRFWQDKWHISPYYATSQVALAVRGVAEEILTGTLAWLLETQHPNGSWGFDGGTAEETAYAMQTLLSSPERLEPMVWDAISRGAAYLSARFYDTDYPELWVGKGLYTPYAIVRSAIISALVWYWRGPGWSRLS
ncbi:conserved hypothetical protein [Nitrolancea hollandica Lb]|uniref:Squalene cyclase C-terminal domain-containing protein n=2 Tax=Nitrolancea hollandica TaxID=1206749 RepID=I4EKS1_9BACT|nr:conserved hypothetical protein [Nitrolancea hollandica Lb]